MMEKYLFIKDIILRIGFEFGKMCKYLNVRCFFLLLVNRFNFFNNFLLRRINFLNSWYICYFEEDKEVFLNGNVK